MEVERAVKGRIPAWPACLENASSGSSSSTALAPHRISGRGSKVSSDSPASSGNQKYMCSSWGQGGHSGAAGEDCRL